MKQKKKWTKDKVQDYWRKELFPWEQQQWNWWNVTHRGIEKSEG